MQNYPNLKVDLSNCDKEPIHLTGNVQPHGFLLIFDQETLILEQLSENTGNYLEAGPDELPGKSLAFFLGQEVAETEEQIKTNSTFYPRLLHIREKPFFVFIHKSSGKLILECEPYVTLKEKEHLQYNAVLSSFQAKLNDPETVVSTAGFVAGVLQSILEYDQVYVLKFDQDHNAEVIAEKVKQGNQSFLGHHFPASDIPAPARALLEVKHIRHIPDIEATPAAIIPYLNPSTGNPVDVLQSELRYPSVIHLEYMKNMDSAASISFSVLVKGKLWGLISCNNKKPFLVNLHKRQLCGQLVKAFGNIISGIKEKRDLQEYKNYKRAEKKLIEKLVQKPDFTEVLGSRSLNLLSFTEAGGAAVLLDNRAYTIGLTPDETDLKELASWLSSHNSDSCFCTRELPSHTKRATRYQERACGLLALEISRFNREYIFFFKPEIKEKRIWAGNPEKPAAGKDLQLHPRKSFEKWEETVKGKSKPWTLNETEIAQIFLQDLIAVRLRDQNRNLGELNEEYEAATNDLVIKNKQMEDFTRIITHNLRSPLANMQALHSIYLDNPTRMSPDFFMDKINIACQNMLATIDDLNEVLKTKTGSELHTEKVSILPLIEKVLQSLEATINTKGAEIKTELLAPGIYTTKAYMESILHNLISNALKYASPERKPEVIIKTWHDEGSFNLSVSDNGLGIDLARQGHKLFGIYQTFHQNADSRGVGLYLTKMQIESLGGTIQVESEPGTGTTFTVTLGNSRKDN